MCWECRVAMEEVEEEEVEAEEVEVRKMGRGGRKGLGTWWCWEEEEKVEERKRK